MDIRTGIGFDIHRLAKGRRLLLGGVEIPFSKGLLGHSDGDVLLHAICDAIFGACGMGDIGTHFPDTDPALKDISSSEILKKSCAIAQEHKRHKIINIDAIVVCDEPKLLDYKDDMRKSIAAALSISGESVNIKAKTSESTARDIISSYATVLIELNS